MNQLMDIITELSIDPYRRDEFERSPEDYLRAAGLEPGALAAPDWPGEQLPGAAGDSWSRGAGFFDPGPDPLPDATIPDQEP